METKCPNCGGPLKDGVCSYCGYAAPSNVSMMNNYNNSGAYDYNPMNNVSGYNQGNISEKNGLVALLLCIFVGYFGIHYFYVGKPVLGIVYLFTVGLFGIGWFIDIFRIAFGVFTDANGRVLKL